MSHTHRIIVKSAILLLSLWLVLSGCAYYNYFYNAKKSYEDGEKKRRDSTSESSNDMTSRRSRNLSDYDKCIESAGRMLEYYPDSRWEDDALLILAKAYYWTENYRKAIGKAVELEAKYPDSEFILESKLWLGMSLLQISQPDSGRRVLATLFDSNIEPDLRAQAYFAVGDMYFNEKDWNQSQDYYRKVLDVDSEDEWLRGEAWVKIGYCLRNTDRTSQAIDLYNEILASNPNRKLRFDAKLERGIALRQSQRYDEALTDFEDLLKDAAYIKEFPRVELETARCLKAMGEDDKAKKKLENLTETEKRGSLAAEAFYELGELQWNSWHDLKAAREALAAVKDAERSSETAKAADSLTTLIENLYSSWQWIGFLELQLTMIDSALAGERELLPSDTLYVDSLSLLKSESKSVGKKGGRSKRNRDRFDENSALGRMVEEAIEKETVDTTKVIEQIPVDSSVALDSTALSELLEVRRTQLVTAKMQLAGFHLFKRMDVDSAKYYFMDVLENFSIDENDWIRAQASLAYIARSKGENDVRERLYREILDLYPDGPHAATVREVLGLPVLEVTVDSLLIKYRDAEEVWLGKDDPVAALREYLEIVNSTDSTSELRAKSLLAAAYIYDHPLANDSLALQLYTRVEQEFSGTDFGLKAGSRIREITKGVKGEKRSKNDGSPFQDQFNEEIPFDEDYIETEADEIVYDASEVDDPPILATSEQMLKNFLRSNYPVDALFDNFRGSVELEFQVDKKGKVSDIVVLSVEPEGFDFETSAKKVLEKLRFKAAMYRNKPVAVRMKQIFIFDPIDNEQP